LGEPDFDFSRSDLNGIPDSWFRVVQEGMRIHERSTEQKKAKG